jgi:cytochrome c553
MEASKMVKRTMSAVAMFTTLALASAPLWAAGDVEAGKTAAKGCVGCHGANGEGKGNFPAIAGLDPKKFVQDLQDYKSGKKANAIMKSQTAKMSDADMENLAAYYAGLKK